MLISIKKICAGLLFILCTICYSNVHSQAFQWAIVDSGQCQSNAICVDNIGNVYITGIHSQTVDFDPGPGVYYGNPNPGGGHIFIQKLDNTGNLVWVKFIDCTSILLSRSIKTDNTGNVYVSGDFNFTADFDPGPGVYNLSGAARDVFVLKLTSNGDFVWARSFGGNNTEYNFGLAVDANKNVYTVGSFQSLNADFDPSNLNAYLCSTNGFQDIYISKLDSMGNFVWVKNIGSTKQDVAYDIKTDNNQDLYVTGHFGGVVDFDPGPGFFNLSCVPATGADLFILKLDSNGNLLWVKDTEGGGNDIGYAIAIDAIGNVHVTGSFTSTVDFDGGPINVPLINPNGGFQAFTLKTDVNGNLLWAKAFIGFQSTTLDIEVDNMGGVYSMGWFDTYVDLDPNATIYNVYPSCLDTTASLLLSKLDANGNFVFGKSIGTCNSNSSIGNGIVYKNSILYGTGYFEGVVDFDPGANVYNMLGDSINGIGSAFVFKYNYCGANYNVNYNACDSINLYGTTYYNSGTYVQQFMNAQSCDSNFIMQINIGHNSTGTVTDSSCGDYEYYGQTYSSSGVYTQIIPSAFGCDSTVTLNLTIHPMNVGVTQNGLTFTANATGAVSYQWIRCNPYQILSGETNQTFIATTNGEYAVIITDAECSDTSDCYAIHNVGIKELTVESEELIVFPNPATKMLNVKCSMNNATKEFYNSVGQLLFTTKENEIDVSGYAKGVYYLKAGSAVRKVVVSD